MPGHGHAIGFGTTALTPFILVGQAVGLSLLVEPDLIGVFEAPQNVRFNTIITGAHDRDVEILWDYDDDYQFPRLPADFKAKADRQSGTSVGLKGAHCYYSPGTYNPTATIYRFENGAYQESITVNVDPVVVQAADPDIIERVAISLDGDFTGAPAGYTQLNWSPANGGVPATWNEFLFEPNKAYYFPRGTVIDRGLLGMTLRYGIGTPREDGKLKWDAWGSGPNPKISHDLGHALALWIRGNGHGPITFAHVDWEGGYDVDPTVLDPNWEDLVAHPTPPAEPGNGLYTLRDITEGLDNRPLNISFVNSKWSGFKINIYPLDRVPGSKLAFGDSESTNFFDYGFFGVEQEAVTRLGCHIHQKVAGQQLPVANGGKSWNSPGRPNLPVHGPSRMGFMPDHLDLCSRFYSYRNGWSGTPDEVSPGVTRAADQPANRYAVSNNVPLGLPDNAVISQCDQIGGYSVVGAVIVNRNTPQGNVDRFIMSNSYIAPNSDGFTSVMLDISKPNALIRANIFEWPEEIEHDGVNGVKLVQGGWSDVVGFAQAGDVEFYSNTVILNGNTTGQEWTTETVLGNISNPTGSINYAASNLVQMNGAYDAANSDPMFTDGSSGPLDNGPLMSIMPFAPQSGSPAYEGYTSGLIAPLDFNGNLRVDPFSIGAASKDAGNGSLFTTSDGSIIGSNPSLGQILGTYSFEVARTAAGEAQFQITGVPPGSYLIEFDLVAHSTLYTTDGNVRGRFLGNDTGGVIGFRLTVDGAQIAKTLPDVNGGAITFLANGLDFAFGVENVRITPVS